MLVPSLMILTRSPTLILLKLDPPIIPYGAGFPIFGRTLVQAAPQFRGFRSNLLKNKDLNRHFLFTVNLKTIQVHVDAHLTSAPPPASSARADLLANMPGFARFQCVSPPPAGEGRGGERG